MSGTLLAFSGLLIDLRKGHGVDRSPAHRWSYPQLVEGPFRGLRPAESAVSYVLFVPLPDPWPALLPIGVVPEPISSPARSFACFLSYTAPFLPILP